MRALRAWAEFVLAFAVMIAAGAQAQAVGVAPTAMYEHYEHHVTTRTDEHPAHARDRCQAACRVLTGELPTRVPEASGVAFFCTVRYFDGVRSTGGQTYAPEPGVPKHSA